MKLLNLDIQSIGIPDVEVDSEVKILSTVFDKKISDLKSLASRDQVNISIANEGIFFTCLGDRGNSKMKVAMDDVSAAATTHTPVLAGIRVEKVINANFSIKYLHYFTKGTSISPYVIISLIEGKPLIVEYHWEDLANGNNKNILGYLKFYLAPKLDDPDDAAADDGTKSKTPPNPNTPMLTQDSGNSHLEPNNNAISEDSTTSTTSLIDDERVSETEIQEQPAIASKIDDSTSSSTSSGSVKRKLNPIEAKAAKSSERKSKAKKGKNTATVTNIEEVPELPPTTDDTNSLRNRILEIDPERMVEAKS